MVRDTNGSTRRNFIKYSGIIGTGILGATNTVQAYSTQSVDQVHEDDKFTVSKEDYQNDYSLKQTVKDSPALNSISDSNSVTIYIDKEYVENNLLEDIDSVENESLTSQVANTDQGKKLKKRSEEIDQELEGKIDDSIENYESDSISIQAVPTVQLGNNRKLFDCRQGDAGQGGLWGNKKGQARLGSDQLHCETIVSPGAVGDAWSWAWMGSKFRVTGSGSRTATIIADVRHSGTVWSALAASSNIKIVYKLWNLTDNYVQETTMVNTSVSNNITNSKDVIGHPRKAISTTLEAGKRYRPTIRLRARCSVGFEGGSSADMGQNIDGANLSYEHAKVLPFEVKF